MDTSWVKGKPQIATASHLKARWGFGKPGEKFRCYLCGHKFVLGDTWRFVLGEGKTVNFLVCQSCDGEDVKERFYEHTQRYKKVYWWVRGH